MRIGCLVSPGMHHKHRFGGVHEFENCSAWMSQNRLRRSINGRLDFIPMTRITCSANSRRTLSIEFPTMSNTGYAPIEETFAGFAGGGRQCGMNRERSVGCPVHAKTSPTANTQRKSSD